MEQEQEQEEVHHPQEEFERLPIEHATTPRVRKRVLSFRVNDPTPPIRIVTPELAIRLGVVVHRPYSIWEWNGPTDRMQVTLVFLPHRTSVESFLRCIQAASNRFFLDPDKYCHSDVYDILYEDGMTTFSHEIADPRIADEILVFYVPRVYFRSMKQTRRPLFEVVSHLKTVCVQRL
jgi:hypothetical protein